MLPLLKQKVWQHLDVSGGPWTNNSNESLNHSLKRFTDWKQLKVPVLIRQLEKAVLSQYEDLKKAMVGCGPYSLSNEFQNFAVQPYAWKSWTPKQKEKQLQKFFKALLKPVAEEKTEYSSDGRLLAHKIPNTAGKKVGQRKRYRPEKSSTKPR